MAVDSSISPVTLVFAQVDVLQILVRAASAVVTAIHVKAYAVNPLAIVSGAKMNAICFMENAFLRPLAYKHREF